MSKCVTHYICDCQAEALAEARAEIERLKEELNTAVYMQDKVREERNRAEVRAEKLNGQLSEALDDYKILNARAVDLEQENAALKAKVELLKAGVDSYRGLYSDQLKVNAALKSRVAELEEAVREVRRLNHLGEDPNAIHLSNKIEDVARKAMEGKK